MTTGITPQQLAKLVESSVKVSLNHVAAGGIPFAALIADRTGRVIADGVNEVASESDPTAHAEVQAIRNACRKLHRARLDDMILIASGEPCAMCYTAAQSAGIGEIVFAADREAAASAGFDYRSGYSVFARDPRDWAIPVRELAVTGALAPFNAWRRMHHHP